MPAAERALLPLRAFLGVTFAFAGLQKLANPAFFRAANPVSIQSQLAGAARHSPLHGLLVSLGHVAVPLGVLIALAELAVGLATLVGLHTRLAAAGGLLISFGLFLTVSFHSNPYYTGSDIVFVFAWTPLLLGRPGILSADAYLAELSRQAVRVPEGHSPSHRQSAAIDRRTFAVKGIATAVLAGLGLIGAGLVAGLGRLIGRGPHGVASTALSAGSSPPTTARTTTTTSATTRTTAAGSGTGPTGPSTTASPPATAASRPPGTRLGPASTVPVGGAASFQDPATGDPSLVIQPTRGTFLAFDAVCPHAGCPVQYSPDQHLFVCPCHGSEFNGRTGAVEVGPAQQGLARIAIAEGSDGYLYAK